MLFSLVLSLGPTMIQRSVRKTPDAYTDRHKESVKAAAVAIAIAIAIAMAATVAFVNK